MTTSPEAKRIEIVTALKDLKAANGWSWSEVLEYINVKCGVKIGKSTVESWVYNIATPTPQNYDDVMTAISLNDRYTMFQRELAEARNSDERERVASEAVAKRLAEREAEAAAFEQALSAPETQRDALKDESAQEDPAPAPKPAKQRKAKPEPAPTLETTPLDDTRRVVVLLGLKALGETFGIKIEDFILEGEGNA